MSHELEYRDGRYCMAYSGEVPWHSLGKSVPADLTPAQMLDAAGLNWEVKKVPFSGRLKVGDVSKVISDPKRRMLVRTDDLKVMDIVGNDWNPVQNSEAFAFFHDFVMAGDMEMHTAGSLRGGEMVWALAKVKDSLTEFIPGDAVESFFLFSNPHRYGKGIDVRHTSVRVVCANTHALAFNGGSNMRVSVDHRRKFDAEKVKTMLLGAHVSLDRYKEKAKILAGARYDNETYMQYLKRLFPTTGEKAKNDEPSRAASVIYDLVDTQPGAEFAPGSWWNAFNAVTFGLDHALGRNDDNRMYSAWYGGNGNKKAEAMDLAIDYATAA